VRALPENVAWTVSVGLLAAQNMSEARGVFAAVRAEIHTLNSAPLAEIAG
jgi:hypothetical protein